MLQLLMKHSCQKQQQGFKSFLSCANTCIKQLIFGMIFFFLQLGLRLLLEFGLLLGQE